MNIADAIRKIEDIREEAKEIDTWLNDERRNGKLKSKEVIEAIETISQKKWNEAWNLFCKIDQATKGITLD
jgi:hypothetical protein